MQLSKVRVLLAAAALVLGTPSGARGQAPPDLSGNQPVAANVNSRYVVERADIQPEGLQHKLGQFLLARVRALPGQAFDSTALEELTQRIRQQLPAYQVVLKVTRGAAREQLRVTFELIRKGQGPDVVVPRFLYHSKQNFTLGADANLQHGELLFSAGALSDQDELIERFSGGRFKAERGVLAGGRVRFGMAAEAWRSQWNPAVRPAAEESAEVEIYRTRMHFRPFVAVRLFEPLEWEAGISTHRLHMESPGARHKLSSAAYTSLRLMRRWKGLENSRTLEADYELRVGSGALGSDFAYRRHLASSTWRYEDRRNVFSASVLAGWINGRAPLFERFVLGNSRTLRGWSKWDVAPLGSDQVVHASADYSYREFRVVYDTASSRAFGGPGKVRQSVAVGYGRGFGFLIAFPLRNGRFEPIFMLGMNF